jgi:hypothetical protein
VRLSNSLPHEILSMFNSDSNCSLVNNVDSLINGGPSSSLTISSDFKNESLLFPQSFYNLQLIPTGPLFLLTNQLLFV